MTQPKNTICLWYDKDAEEAARFYAETFPDSAVKVVNKAPGDFPVGKNGMCNESLANDSCTKPAA